MTDMTDSYDMVIRLTTQSLPDAERHRVLREFASANGWNPSDELTEYRDTKQYAKGHLLVEHGLTNTAVITFLNIQSPFRGLSTNEQRRLLSISYNNLVDWHLFPDPNGLTAVYNRAEPFHSRYVSRAEQVDLWRAEAFDRITGRRPSANVKALNDALIDTISFWKRALSAEIESALTNEQISALFNTTILVRALEDYRQWTGESGGNLLIDTFEHATSKQRNAKSVLSNCLKKLGTSTFPPFLRDSQGHLAAFDDLDPATVRQLFSDFYRSRNSPYDYDFFLISKHAMSRIYEHYVSVLRERDSDQLRLFRDLPEEEANRATGGVYTPQFIARFFARFVKDNLTPKKFRELRSADPTCGSGIFLRTVLEMQCDPLQDADFRQITDTAYRNVFGMDVDANACQATRLSLSLLYLVLRGTFPHNLHIENAEAVEYIQSRPKFKGTFDAVFANPPFIRLDLLEPAMQARIVEYMGDLAHGRADMYLAILKAGMEMVKDGGFCLFVLPHSFLIAENASKLRQAVLKDFWIRVIVDLSEIPVFGKIGSYVVLLVLERKTTFLLQQPRAIAVQCRELVGHALQAALEGRMVKTSFYSVFDLDQQAFGQGKWHLLPPTQSTLLAKLRLLKPLGDFLAVREGSVTGADDVFVAPSGTFVGETAVWLPLLSDREMRRYDVPASTESVMFYPYVNGEKLDGDGIKKRFPKTWKHLLKHEQRLRTRGSVKKQKLLWWMPERPRSPVELLRPKIVSPHLVVLPKFSLDAKGRIAISRSPFLFPLGSGDEERLLAFFLGVLNSSVGYWQIAKFSHRYSRGYSMLEPKTLQGILVPDPSDIAPARMKRLLGLVQERLRSPNDTEIEGKLDLLVTEVYGLNDAEREELGVGRES